MRQMFGDVSKKQTDKKLLKKSIIYHGRYFSQISTHDIAQYKGMKKKM